MFTFQKLLVSMHRHGGQDLDVLQLATVCEELGAGEILLNCIDREGTNAGFYIELVRHVSGAVSIPVIASSGAGRVEYFSEVFKETDVEAALAAGIFHRQKSLLPQSRNNCGRRI